MTAVSVVMPCYNRSYDLNRTLHAYDHQTTAEPFEVIAVDDGSSDKTFKVLSDYQPVHYRLQPIRLSTNRGPGAARNIGIERASAPLIVFVGDDILPAPDFVESHLRAHRRHPDAKVAILGHVTWPDDLPQNTLMKHIDGRGAQQFSYFYLQDGAEYDYRHFYTANVSIKRQMLDQVDHWFDNDFIYAAYEDPELAYRLSQQGLRIFYDASIRGQHYHYHSIWSFAIRQQRCGHMAWIFVKKHPKTWKDILPEFWWQLGLSLPKVTNIRRSSTLDGLEAQIIHLACYYEWSPNLLLDYLYIEVLKYFFYKGALEYFFADSRLRGHLLSAYAKASLLPVLQKFVWEARTRRINLPEGFVDSLV